MKTIRDIYQEKWIRHFENNRLHRQEPDWEAPFAMEEKNAAHWRGPWRSISLAMEAGLAV